MREDMKNRKEEIHVMSLKVKSNKLYRRFFCFLFFVKAFSTVLYALSNLYLLETIHDIRKEGDQRTI